MRIAVLRRHSLVVAVAVLAGCAGAQLPNQAPPLLPSTANRAHKVASYVYVGQCCNFFNHDVVTVYDLALTGVARTITKGVDEPDYVTVDRSGRLYYIDWFGSGVIEYDRGSEGPSRRIKLRGAWAAANDTSNNLYVAACPACVPYQTGRASVNVYKAGTTTLLRSITKGIDAPVAVAVDSDDNLYVAGGSYARPAVTVYAPGSSKPLRTLTKGLTGPTEVALDPSNDVFVLNNAGSSSGLPSVVEYEAASTKVLRTITNGLSSPQSIAVDGSGTLYAANTPAESTGWISVYKSGASSPSYEIKNGVDDPMLITVDSENNLYVANNGYSAAPSAPLHRRPGGRCDAFKSRTIRHRRWQQVRDRLETFGYTGSASVNDTIFDAIASGDEHLLYRFSGREGIADPGYPLVAKDGFIYGARGASGGAYDYGSVLVLSPDFPYGVKL
jgi:sugar lactone lactonase YvrE